MFLLQNWKVRRGWFISTKEVKRGNLPFVPFCCQLWRLVIVPPDNFVSRLSKQFLSVSIAFFVCTYITHTFMFPPVNALQWKYALLVPKQSGGAITNPPCVTIKMVAKAIALHTVVKRDLIPAFNFLDRYKNVAKL